MCLALAPLPAWHWHLSFSLFLSMHAKNAIFEPLKYVQTIILPRQARDTHRENSKQKMAFSASCASSCSDRAGVPSRGDAYGSGGRWGDEDLHAFLPTASS
jgi:hypothetical protein